MADETAAPLIDFSTVDVVEESKLSHKPEAARLLFDAANYLHSFEWVEEISKTYVGNIFEGIIGIFLFKIEPKLVGVDDYTWVITGDLPDAYITAEECSNPSEALDAYIGAMEEWVDAVLSGKPTVKIIPVGASATRENAMELKSRLELLDRKILPLCNGRLG